jgi:hypothetical protein
VPHSQHVRFGVLPYGTDPAAIAKEQGLWQDTMLSQMGKGRLAKAGAVIERTGPTHQVLMCR